MQRAGRTIAGIPGAIVATAGCVLPGVALSLALSAFFRRHAESLYAAEVLRGLKAASVGLIMGAAASILMLTFFGTSSFSGITRIEWTAAVLAAVSFLLLRKWKWNPILVLLVAGLAGALLYGMP